MSVSLKHRVEYAGLWSLWRFANALHATNAQSAGRGFGRMVGQLWRSRRRIAPSNLKRAFPDMDDSAIACLVSETFANIGTTVFEVLRFPHPQTEDWFEKVEIHGAEHVQRAAEAGNGALLMSAHLGNWEMLGALVRRLGHPVDLVIKPLRNPLSDKLINECRSSQNVGLIQTQVGTDGITGETSGGDSRGSVCGA